MVRDWMASHVVFLSDPEAVSLAAGGSVRVDDYVRDPVGEQYPQLRRSGVIRGDWMTPQRSGPRWAARPACRLGCALSLSILRSLALIRMSLRSF